MSDSRVSPTPSPPSPHNVSEPVSLLEQTQRKSVVAEAISWLRTPWHHMGAVKGVGVDCGQMVAKVFIEVGLVEEFSTGYYSMQHHLNREEEMIIAIVERFAVPIPEEAIKPGDIVLYKFGKTFSHLGIIVDWPLIVHAFVRTNVEYADGIKYPFLDKEDNPLERCFYSYWGEQVIG